MAIDADLLLRIRQIWEAARVQAARSVNTAHVVANGLIGQQIVEAEQAGEDRAAYGDRLLVALSARLTADYGSGFSPSALKYMRQFYVGYPTLVQIGHALRDQSTLGLDQIDTVVDSALQMAPGREGNGDWHPGQIHSALSWTHYRTLLRVTNSDSRSFYEIEAVRNGWSAR